MAFIKNDVTEEELDNLFNKNITTGFESKKEESSEDNDKQEVEPLISSELDVKSQAPVKIERPDDYKKDEVHAQKLKLRKEEEAVLEKPDDINQVSGRVSSRVFKEIAKVREKALLEAYKESQAKLPTISKNAKVKLWGDEECKFHVYRIYQMVDSNNMICTCKFCSHQKMFSMLQWMKYQLENSKYM